MSGAHVGIVITVGSGGRESGAKVPWSSAIVLRRLYANRSGLGLRSRRGSKKGRSRRSASNKTDGGFVTFFSRAEEKRVDLFVL